MTEANHDLAMAVADSMAQADRKIFDLLGVRVGQVNVGSAEVFMTVREDMVNSHGFCHGGFVYALADTAFAYAASSHNRATVTLCGQIQYIKPARLDDHLRAFATVTSMGGRTGTCEVVVTNQQDVTVARFSGTAFRMEHEVVAQGDTD